MNPNLKKQIMGGGGRWGGEGGRDFFYKESKSKNQFRGGEGERGWGMGVMGGKSK